MLPMIEQREGSMTMTGFKTRLAILATLVGCAPELHAQAPARGEIVLQGIIGPETETVSLRAVCYSRAFSFTIVNHRFKPSALSDARVGRRQPSVQSTAALRQFLAGARDVHFGSSMCISENEIGINLYGLLISPPQGQRDDVIRSFRISFR